MTFQYDFRSDTVTKPGRAMRQAMAEAEVGDDVYGECPTTRLLQERCAAMFGKEGGLYFPSGTQTNLAGVMSHCGRGDEVILSQKAHVFLNEAGGVAVLGSVQSQPVPISEEGIMDVQAILGAIKPDDQHFARTRLVAMENTFNGAVVPQAHIDAVTGIARDAGLGTHLDGARILNASVASGIAPAELVKNFDTVSVCLSKGLGAPVGSVLVGSTELISRARRVRKLLGGGMRQAGILAAAGLVGLTQNVDRLDEDHARAEKLAAVLAGYPALCSGPARTNMIFMTPIGIDTSAILAHFAEYGVGVSGRYGTLRWVTHLDIDDAAVERVAQACKKFFG